MSHPHRHRSPFHLRRDPGSPAPAPVPLVVVDGPSPLGTAASTFVALGLLGSSPSVTMTTVADLHPPRRPRLPDLDELAGALAERIGGAGPVDLVGVGLGAIVALRLALDGGPVRRIVAVDAPVPAYRASELLAAERYWGVPLRTLADRAGSSAGTGGPAALPAELAGALPDTVDAAWIRRDRERHPAFGRPVTIPVIADRELVRLEQPVLCINSPRADVVTAGDHVARLAPTTQLLRLRTTDTTDHGEQVRVSEALHGFLGEVVPTGPAFRPAGAPPVPEVVVLEDVTPPASAGAGATSPAHPLLALPVP